MGTLTSEAGILAVLPSYLAKEFPAMLTHHSKIFKAFVLVYAVMCSKWDGLQTVFRCIACPASP
jgi:hypothetical protein